MGKMAVSNWNGCVSSVFDFSNKRLFVSMENGQESHRCEVDSPDKLGLKRKSMQVVSDRVRLWLIFLSTIRSCFIPATGKAIENPVLHVLVCVEIDPNGRFRGSCEKDERSLP